MTAKKRGIVNTYLMYLLLALVILFPATWVLFGSIKPTSELFAFPATFIPQAFTLENYVSVLQRTPMLLYLKNTVLVALLTVFGSLLLAAPGAYGFSRFDFRLKYPLLIAMLGLQLIPSTVNIIPYYVMFARLNLLNSLTGLTLIYISGRIPFSIWILKGFFDSLPESIIDAAKVDGCSPMRTFWTILLPLSLPGLGAAGFLSFLAAWGELLIPLTVASSRDVAVVSVGLYTFFGEGFTAYNQLFAATMMSVLPILVVFFFSQQSFIAGLTRGTGK